MLPYSSAPFQRSGAFSGIKIALKSSFFVNFDVFFALFMSETNKESFNNNTEVNSEALTLSEDTKGKVAFLMRLSNDKKKYLIGKYFREKIDESKTGTQRYKEVVICVFPGCENIERINKSSNLIRHLARSHFTQIDFSDETIRRSRNLAVKEFFHKEKSRLLSFYTTETEFFDAVLNLVLSGVSFLQLETPAFRYFLKPYCEGFNSTINRHNVRQIISNKFDEQRLMYISLFKEKMVSLKLDGTTLHGDYFVGINAQIELNNIIEVVNIGIVRLYSSSNSSNLANRLLEVLGEFEISSNQIFSITTDNAANYLKIGRLVSDIVIENSHKIDEASNASLFNVLLEDQWYGFNEEDIVSITETIADVQVISCGVHTLQLAVHDSLKNLPPTFIKARTIVKKLRTPGFKIIMEEEKIKRPTLDVPTRWNSTFYMIKSLLSIKDFTISKLGSEKEFKLTPLQWESLEKFVDVFKFVEEFTRKCQDKRILLSDFVMLWLNCEKETKETSNCQLKTCLVNNLVSRRSELFKNPLVMCSIYVDPRFKSLIINNPEEHTNVTRHLVKLFNKIRMFQVSFEHAVEIEDKPKELFDYAGAVFNKGQSPTNVRQDDTLDKLMKELTVYDSTESIHTSKNPLEHWKNAKEVYPNLSKLSLCILSAPASQVSVESSFSVLKWYLSDKRSLMDRDVLMKLLFLKINSKISKESLDIIEDDINKQE